MTTVNPAQSSTNLFRRLSWQGSIPLEIRLADNEPGSGSGADRYYTQAPRYTYLPLLIPEIRENLVELCLDERQLSETKEEEWWFEEEPSDDPASFAGQGACRWHWPLDLIQLYSTISHPCQPSSSKSSQPLKLLLHLSNPPIDKLMMPNTIEICKTHWLNQVKEADFVRWRNTNKVTSLRRVDLEAGWDGIVQDDYDLYMRMASRILPLPIPPPPQVPASTLTTQSAQSRPASTDPGSTGPKAESAYTARALPVKLYLPDGAPVVQEVIPPLGTDGNPTTLLSLLHTHLPLLFPSTPDNPYPLAYPIAQGVEIPPEAELAWLVSCLCGADGWLRVGIRLRAE